VAAERIIIMPGSGVRSTNIEGLIELSGAVEFHTSAGKMRESGMEFRNLDMEESLQWLVPDGNEIDLIKKILSNR
jgi:copper homeostasis protein